MQLDTIRSTHTPKNLVEDRVAFAGPNSELSIYDTYEPAENVALFSGELLYCGMITGKKSLHDDKGFLADFMPKESFVMAPGEKILIDFPEAERDSPTTCLTVEITTERVKQICDSLNRSMRLETKYTEWHYRDHLIHTPHSTDTQQLLERLVHTFTDSESDRDLLIDLGVSELVVRMLRYQTREMVLQLAKENPELNGLSAAISQLIKQVELPLDIEGLSRIACMSRSRFFEEFKKHLGCTPAQLQQRIRLQRAAELLLSGHSVTETCFQLGFQSPSHFSRRFTEFYGVSPKGYKNTT